MEIRDDGSEETRNIMSQLREKYSHSRAKARDEERICVIEGEKAFLTTLQQSYAHQPLFLEAVESMAASLTSLFEDAKDGDFYRRAFLFLTEPERMISFRVPWTDDKGCLRYNRGWRVEFSSVLGPFKGGLRFHPTVDDGVLKFLGFDQIFKNALTGLPLGGGKGGSDFDPKGKSDGEVRRFCESFMTELFRYLHPSTDVPAGDIGVGSRELGYLYGQYKRLTNKHGGGVLTGKSVLFGGSHLRPEATGFGLIYMAKIAIEKRGDSLNGARCMVSGSGNVAQYASRKLLDSGAKVLSMSDSDGCLVFENGMSEDDWKKIVEAKQVHRARLSSLGFGKYIANHSPWTMPPIKCDYAFPCATQNEITGYSAETLIRNGVRGVFEGANMPTDVEGREAFKKILFIPGIAANAGGVTVSGLEMSQNAQKLSWTEEEVDSRLQTIMSEIYDQMEQNCDSGTLEDGANRAGFLKIVEAMKDMGWVY